MTSESEQFVSVIIPVYNDSRNLATCLSALEKQTYPRDRYEIIVVDNASEEDIRDVVSKFSGVILSSEERRSSYAARNRGISIAKGDIMAFIDSDCVADPDWLRSGVEVLLNAPEPCVIGGKVETHFEDPGHLTAVELYQVVDRPFPQEHYIRDLHFVLVGNLFTSRSVFERVGLFNDRLKSGGDVEWGLRVYSSGIRQVYAENVRVSHPAIHTLRALRRKLVRVTGGHHDIERNRNVRIGAFERLLRFLYRLSPPVRYLAAISRKDEFLKLKPAEKAGVLGVVVICHYTYGIEALRLNLGGRAKNC